ncbi:hypothetical protein Tco_0691149 [Tanacetum coccineum]
MSSASFAVTYTYVYTDSEPGRVFWRADEELSDGGSPRVIVYGYDGLPMQPIASPSPNYVPGPEHPSSPDYVPRPEHPPSPVEPYLPDAHRSPSQLRGGIRDPEEDPEEDFEEDHADYPADGGDDDEPTDDDDDTDDEDEEPFKDEEDDKEEEERLALADLSVGESSTAAPRPTGGHGADYGFIDTMNAEIRNQRAEEVGYGIRDVWVDPSEAVEGDRTGRLIEGSLSMIGQTQIYQRVDILAKDRQFHYETARLLDQEAFALQARDQTHAGDHEEAGSSAYIYIFHVRFISIIFVARPNVLLGFIPLIARQNNMPPRRTSAAATAAADATAAAPMTAAAVEQLIEARVSAALANHEILQNSTNGHGDGSHNSDTGIRGTVRTPRECTYKDFLNCKPLTFKGTEGVVVLAQWFERMESVFHISNCAVENQVKFATCTFLGNALTWWNSHMKAVTQDVAYAMDWKTLKKMMTDKYYPRGEIKKLEIELWKPKV